LNLVDFVKNVLTYFKDEAITNDIDLNLDADFFDIAVWADEKMLEKIVFNVLSNAIKTTPKGGTINVGLQASDTLFENEDFTSTDAALENQDSASERTSNQKHTLLIVEDNQELRRN